MRGRLQPGADSWHWRWYKSWQRLSGDSRSQIDLCHYVRVLLIFGPWRWFWQASYTRLDLMPWVIVFMAGLAGTLGYLTYLFPMAMLELLIVLGAALLIGAIMCLIILGILYWGEKDPESLERTVIVVTAPIWWPAVKIGHGARFFYQKTIFPAGTWFFMRPIFGGRTAFFWLFAPAFIGTILFTLGSLFYFFTETMIVISIIMLGFATLSALVVWKYDAINAKLNEWDDKAMANRVEKRIDPKHGPSFFRVIWQWIVAKKHRICPLIDPPEKNRGMGDPETLRDHFGPISPY